MRVRRGCCCRRRGVARRDTIVILPVCGLGWMEEGLRMQRGREGGHVIACGGTDEVGEDDTTSSSHRCAVIVVTTKWRWSYPHPIALWVTRRMRARARASLALSSLSSLLRQGGDDRRRCSHSARICMERACGGTRQGQGPVVVDHGVDVLTNELEVLVIVVLPYQKHEKM